MGRYAASTSATAWSLIPSKNKAEDLKKSIAAYEAVLTVYTKEAYPAEWAKTQNDLGNAWSQLSDGRQG